MVTMRPKVWLACDISEVHEKHFTQFFDIIYFIPNSKQQLIDAFSSKLSAISAGYIGWDGLSSVGKFDADLVNSCPQSLKIIASSTVGVDHLDHVALRKRGIDLTNVPSYLASNEDVADSALYLTLNVFRHFTRFDNQSHVNGHTMDSRIRLHTKGFNYEEGKFGQEPVAGFAFGHVVGGKKVHSPHGKNAAIIGFGSIGRAIGERLNSLGMNIHYTKRTPLEKKHIPKHYNPIYHDSLESLVRNADLIVVSVPGSADNYHMINDEIIAMLPERGSRIVNIARGSVLDTGAIVRGLQSGKLISVGLDVYEQEPNIDAEFLGRDDVYLLPHIGSSTVEIFESSTLISLNDIVSVLNGEKPRWLIN